MKILILCDYDLPDSSASANRAFEFAKIFTKIGHKVDILGTGYSRNEDFTGEYQGFIYKVMSGKNNTKGIHARFQRMNYIKEKMKKEIQYRNSQEKIDVIFLVGYIWDYHKTITDVSKKNKIKLISDVVEWYDKDSFSGIFGPIKYVQNRIGLIYLLKQKKNLVCISSLLENYYFSKNCNVVRIPTILDMKNYNSINYPDNKKIILAYAGMPRKKDKILNVIKAISLLDKSERKKIEFRIYGPTLEELKVSGITEEYLESTLNVVKCYGRIPQKEVKNELQKADFTVLIRPNKRYANAGFPTKVGESMASGVPVIANNTSDLAFYLKHKKNALVVSDDTPEQFSEALKIALNIDRSDLKRMREEAYREAQKSFDLINYVKPMDIFLSKLR